MWQYFTGNLGQVTALIAKIDNQVGGYPTSDGRTLTYADPLPHQGSGQPAVYLMPVQPLHSYVFGRQGNVSDIDAISTLEEITNRKSESELRAEGAFTWPDPR